MLRDCIVDANGKIINIGAWDDRDGANPLPTGAVTEQRDIVESPDGGLVESGTYVDADAELSEAITNATTLEELKKALLGNNGNIARVKGRRK